MKTIILYFWFYLLFGAILGVLWKIAIMLITHILSEQEMEEVLKKAGLPVSSETFKSLALSKELLIEITLGWIFLPEKFRNNNPH